MKTQFLLLAVVGLCYIRSTSSAAFDFGISALSGSNIENRFAASESAADTWRVNMEAVGFTGILASTACTANLTTSCGTNSNCTDEAYPNSTVSYVFSCTCHTGFVSSTAFKAHTCNDIDECSNSTWNNCHVDADCNNLPGGYNCSCKTGFSGNGTYCENIDECVPNQCAANATCTDGIATFTCACDSGFSGDPYTNCSNIDECSNSTLNNCHATLATCTDTEASYYCTCNNGFSGDGVTCNDIDECINPSTCHTDANCINSIGSHTCVCNSGFTGDGVMNCTNIDNCVGVSYHPNGTCNDLVNNYTLSCVSGYSGNGTVCDEIDECNIDPFICDPNANCTNTDGSYMCTCMTGYFGDGKNCTTRTTLNTSFNIFCTNYIYTADLLDTTSDAYVNLTGILNTSVTNLISSLDNPATFTASFSFSNTTGYNDTKVVATLALANTILDVATITSGLSSLSASSECGAVASGDECSVNNGGCASGTTCADTDYGFCCYRTLTYRAQLEISGTFNSSFDDSTSVPYQTLDAEAAQLFKDQLAQLDQRGCSASVAANAEVMLNGSIVYVGLLDIVNATYDVTDITAKLASATGSTSFGSIISVGDFDECSSKYDTYRNCSAFADCLNGDGFFSCSCFDTTYDNSTGTATGEICLNPVTVDCSGGSSIKISVLEDYYTRNSINITSLHLANETCNSSTHASVVGDSVEFTVSINDCGTTLSTNSTTKIVSASNYITNLPSTGVFTALELKVPFQCALPNNVSASAGFNGSVDSNVLPTVVADGSFSLLFGLYNSTYTALETKTTYLSTDTIYGMVSVQNAISDLSVFLDNCWGTPDSNADNAVKHFFMQSGCPVTGAANNFQVHANGNGNAQFSTTVFFFRQTNSIYLHCDINVCSGTCAPACATGRRRKRRSAVVERQTRTIVILLDPSDPSYFNGTIDTNPGPAPTNNITITIIACVLCLVLISLLAVIVILAFRKRKARKDDYDLTHVNMHAIGVKPPSYS